MLVYYLHPSLPFGLGVGHLHLMMLLHIMHSSDRPPSPPVNIDLTLFPGQLLASSKLFPCCVQYFQRLLTLPTLSLPLWPLVFFPSPLVGGAPPTIVPPTTTPTTGCSNVPGGCCMVGGSITSIIVALVVAADCIPNAAFSSRSLASPGAALATASQTL